MTTRLYYWGIAIIALIMLINFNVFGNLMGHVVDGFPIYYSSLLINLLLYVAIIFFAFLRSIISSLLLFLASLDTYHTSLSSGIKGFSMPDNIAWQPLLTTWLAMFSIIFCIIGGAYLFFKRSSKR